MSGLDWHDVLTGEGLPPEAAPEPAPQRERPPLEIGGPTTSEACQAERARVLRHPEIAKRLCDPPQSYSRPEMWTGYLPPDTWNGRTNDSPVRKQLLAIVAAAVEAEKAADQ